MLVAIRKMDENDAAAWASMRQKLWDNLPLEEHLKDITNMLRSPKRSGYIAILSDLQPAGFAEISIREYANGCDSQPVPFLEGIWIFPKYRRQGIGRSFVEKITSDLLENGFTEIGSDADIRNWRSHHAHESWGFEETERVVYFRKLLK